MFVLLLCSELLGCRGFSRIGECKRFVALANPAIAELQELDTRNQPTPKSEAYLKIAERLTTLDQQLEQLQVTDTQLVQAVSGYRSTLQRTIEYSKEYQKNLASLEQTTGDTPADKRRRKRFERLLSKTRGEMDKVLRSHQASQARFEALCQPRH